VTNRPAKLPSRVTVEGVDRAPHRAFLRGLGLSDADIDKPFVGVASTANNVTPCNAGLGDLAREACIGVREAGGVPFDFASISVADSMSMNHGGMRYSLMSRELIADGVEAVVRGHAYDALVTFAGCDKTLPGMMMAMVRLNLPSVFVYGGAALPGSWRGRDVTVLDTYEGIGALLAGDMSASELDELEHACLPTIGACPGQFTANTMAMVSETLGLALPGSATMPAARPPAPATFVASPPPMVPATPADPEGEERARILAALDACAGNQTRAARMLGISRATLVNKLAVHRIPRPRG
jgi:dihydroxy-acid dehydratase